MRRRAVGNCLSPGLLCVISAILTVVQLLPIFPQLQTCRCTALTDAMCTEAAIEPDLRLALAKPRFR